LDAISEERRIAGSAYVCPELKPFLSVVVPAFNEEHRLPATLAAIGAYLSAQPYTSELIVVDDGSTDATLDAALAMRPCVGYRVISQQHKGKAAAVRSGVLAAEGQRILFTDADLSTPIAAAAELLERIENGAAIAIGSREGASARRIDEPLYRHIMGRAFNWIVRVLAVRGIDDTQCGFKMFRRDAAGLIFPALRLHQSASRLVGPRVSAFDVEILFLAQRLALPIAEVPVTWTHAQGSKVRPGVDALRMLADVLAVRLNALSGKYNDLEAGNTNLSDARER
jgi:glycosyltransferase involved in cell wall biosynthesis